MRRFGWALGGLLAVCLAACGDDDPATADTTAATATDAATDTQLATDTGATSATADDTNDATSDPDTTVAPETDDDVPDAATDAPDPTDGATDAPTDAPDPTDGATDAPDPDTTPGVPLPGFGAITGDCGVLDDELTASGPSFFINHFDFGTDPYDDADLDQMTAGAQEILADGNAGGSSIRSEMFAFELLARCELATLVKTENEVLYDDAESKKTDMVLIIDGLKIAANPTRAIGFPFDAPYTKAQAKTILEKKLGDINESTLYVSAADRWLKQILIVFAYAEGHVTPIEQAYAEITAELKADTIVIVTVTDGADGFIYTDQN